MTDDLKKTSEKFIELGGKLTKGEWIVKECDGISHEYYQLICKTPLQGPPSNSNIMTAQELEIFTSDTNIATEEELWIFATLPEMIAHIKALQEQLDETIKERDAMKEAFLILTDGAYDGRP